MQLPINRKPIRLTAGNCSKLTSVSFNHSLYPGLSLANSPLRFLVHDVGKQTNTQSLLIQRWKFVLWIELYGMMFQENNTYVIL